jgi:hypothetical protein
MPKNMIGTRRKKIMTSLHNAKTTNKVRIYCCLFCEKGDDTVCCMGGWAVGVLICIPLCLSGPLYCTLGIQTAVNSTYSVVLSFIHTGRDKIMHLSDFGNVDYPKKIFELAAR